jgi:glycosyltransferase involved in cell wall biosynthesis
MQQMNYELIRRLSRHADTTVIKWGGSQSALPFFLPWAFVRSLPITGQQRRPDIIYLGDGLLAPLGAALKKILNRPVAVTVHGLDVTYTFPLYRTVIAASLKRLDRIIAVSRHTASLCRNIDVDETRCITIPNGVDCAAQQASNEEKATATEWLKSRGITTAQRFPIIITAGRLVKRKGVAPFIRNVLPRLSASHPTLLYIVIGEGPERNSIKNAAGRTDTVLLTGRLPRPLLKGLMALGHIFVMPNIPVTGDAEGFGLVALEAVCAGLPVVAADLEGIRDAVVEGKNGRLVPAGDVERWRTAITEVVQDEEKRKACASAARAYTAARFSWDRCAAQYLTALQALRPREV